MSTPMIVRRLRTGDEEAAIDVIHRLKPAEERDGLDASVVHMNGLLSRDENYLYVAYLNDRPVGFLLAYRLPRIDRDREMVYLYEIAVRPSERRKGIGSELIKMLKEDCGHDNVMEVWVGTSTDNEAARALFRANGGRESGETFVEYLFTEF